MKPINETLEYYGSTVIGEKGQVVIPADLRSKFGINPGDKFLVLGGSAWGVIFVKADVVSTLIRELLGSDFNEIMKLDTMDEGDEK